MPERVSLHDIAPRLAKARDQELERRRRIARAQRSFMEVSEGMIEAYGKIGIAAGEVAKAMGELYARWPQGGIPRRGG